MTLGNFFKGRAAVFTILIVILGLIAAFYSFNNYIRNKELGTASPAAHEPYRATLSGTYLCLPHRDTSGPQTLECALGLKTDAGEYYAMDFNLMSQTPPTDIPTGTRITASGVVTPVERLNTDQWQRYPIQGIFSVTDAVKID